MFSVEVLNSIRENADSLYQDRVPVATKDNISQIGRVFEQYDVVYNTFISALFHKIGKTYIETKGFKNKLAPFKTGAMYSQQDVEEIFVDQFRQAEGAYDKDGGVGEGGINPFKRRAYNEVKNMFHRMNRQDKYVVTISKVDVVRAFKSANTLDSFMTAQFNSIYTGAEYDEYIHMKKILSDIIKEKNLVTYEVEALDGTPAKAQGFIRSAKKAIKDMSYVSTLYNLAGVKTYSDPSELVMFVNKDVGVHMDVDFYTQVFGPEYSKLNIKVVELDNFGDDNTGTDALICDGEIFKVWDTLSEFRQLENPEGLYTNYWYHVWQILSFSKFKNVVRLGRKITQE